MSSDSPVLLYDGECGFCAWGVQFVLAREAHVTSGDGRLETGDGRASARLMRFAPLKGAFGAEVRRQHPETATVDSVIWYLPAEPGVARAYTRAYTRSDAALGVLGYLGGWWGLLAALGRAVPRPLRDAVYDAIARRRFTLVSRACLLPSAQQRHRFLT